MLQDILKIIGAIAILAGSIVALKFVGDGFKVLKTIVGAAVGIILVAYIIIILIFK